MLYKKNWTKATTEIFFSRRLTQINTDFLIYGVKKRNIFLTRINKGLALKKMVKKKGEKGEKRVDFFGVLGMVDFINSEKL